MLLLLHLVYTWLLRALANAFEFPYYKFPFPSMSMIQCDKQTPPLACSLLSFGIFGSSCNRILQSVLPEIDEPMLDSVNSESTILPAAQAVPREPAAASAAPASQVTWPWYRL